MSMQNKASHKEPFDRVGDGVVFSIFSHAPAAPVSNAGHSAVTWKNPFSSYRARLWRLFLFGSLALLTLLTLRMVPLPALPFFGTPSPTFTIDRELVPASATPRFTLHGDEQATITSLRLVGPTGDVQSTFSFTRGDGEITIEPKLLEAFHPGLYKAIITFFSRGKEATLERSYEWGVVAVNVRRSVSHPNESNDIAIAVLDDYGRTICDSDVTVVISDPSGMAQTFTTGLATVRRNPDCQDRSVTNTPDYDIPYAPNQIGTYTIAVTATTPHGERHMTDTFVVADHIPFDVIRDAFPTRIYPPAAYPVVFHVTPSEDFVGSVSETVPASFALSNTRGATIEEDTAHGTRRIDWKVAWQAGQTYTLSYTFDAPNISPLLYKLGPLTFRGHDGLVVFAESRQWQIASDATKTWDGEGSTANWSEGANWSGNTQPADNDDIVFDGTSNDPSTWDAGATIATAASISVTGMSGDLVFTKTPVTVTNDFSHTSTGNVSFFGSASISVGGNFTLTTSGSFSFNTSTLTMTGTSKAINTNKQLYNFTIDSPGDNTTITAQTNGFFVNNTLVVQTGDTFSLNPGITVQHVGATLTLNGTLAGNGEFDYYSATAVPTTGTINVDFALFASNNNLIASARTYGRSLRFYYGGSTDRTITLGTASSQTITVTNDLTFLELGSGTFTVTGATNNPAVTVGGILGVSGGTPTVVTGNGTWTFGGNVDLTSAIMTFTSGNTLVMNGTSRTLTTDSETLQNVTLSGSITLANATHTIAGNLSMTGGTITAGSSTVSMTGTSNTLTGASQTLNNLTIDPSSAGTITLQTSDLLVSGTLSVASSDALSIAASRILTSTSTGTVTINGTISGSGTLRLRNSSLGTGGTLSSVVAFDLLSGDITMPARTYGGNVQITVTGASSGQTVTLGSGTHIIQGNLTVSDNGIDPSVLSGSTNNPTVNITGALQGTLSGGGTSIITGTGTWTVTGNLDLTNISTLTVASGNTFVMDGTSNLIGNAKTFQNLTINGSGNTVSMITSDFTVSGTLTIGGAADGNNDTLDIASGRILTSSSTGTITLVGSGTDLISGAGTLRISNSNLGTGGSITSIVQYNNVDVTMPARIYGGLVEIRTVGTTRTVTMGAGTFTFSGALNILATGAGNMTLTGATNDPTVNITGDVDFTGAGAGTEILTTGSGTWTVSGNVDMTAGTLTAESGHTLVMNGTSKTLTSNSQTLQNLTLSGSITLANATHTVAGNLSLSGGTITAGSSTVTMTGTSNSIIGGGATLNNITIDPSSSGTITLQTSDLTTAGTVDIATGDTLSIASGRVFTQSGATTLTLSGSITGAGTYAYQSSTTFPTTGTVSSILRFDTLNTDQSAPARTYGGAVEFYNSSSSNARVVTLGTAGSQTLTFSSSFLLNAVNTQNITVTGVTNSPTITIGGDLDFTGVGSGTELVSTGTGTWTVTGNVDLVGGTFTATSGNILVLDGTANFSPSNTTFSNLTVNGNGNTVTMTTNDATVSGTLTIGGAADGNNDTLSISSGVTLTSATTGTVTINGSGTDTISGAGTLSVRNSNLSSNGTLSSIVRFNATSGGITMPARTYDGLVEIFNSGGAGMTVTMSSGTHTLSGALHLLANGSANITIDGSANNPTVNVTGDVYYTGTGGGSEVIQTGTGIWTLSGNADFTGGTFTATSGNTLRMNGTSKTLTSASQTLQNFAVTGGSVATADALDVNGTFQVTSGTFTQAAGANMNIAGNFTLSSGITFTRASGAGIIIFDGDLDYTDNTSPLQDIGSVQVGTSPDKLELATDLAATSLTVAAGDRVNTNGFDLDIGNGGVTISGILDATDDVETDETMINTAGTFTLNSGGTFTADQSTIIFDRSAGTVDLITLGTGNPYNVTLNDAGGSLTVEVEDPLDIDNNLTITGGTLDVVSGENNAINAGGSWDNNDIFTARAGLVTFDAGATGKTIEAGSSPFYDVVFNNASGGWTIQTDNFTTSNNLTLTAASSFTVQSGRTLEVQGAYTETVSGAATTWTGSTLYLNGSGGMYEILSKTHGGDAFATIRIGASEDVAMWDSSVTTVTTDSGGCLFSQDHGGTSGRMDIYGTCNSRSNEYWSYATDFDGAVLGLSRQADVRFADAASLTVDAGDALAVLGQSSVANRTLITRQSTGNFGLAVNGIINAQYYDLDYVDASGLNIGSTATVSELSNGSFDNAGSGASSSYITVSGITSTKSFSNNIFDASLDGTDTSVVYNVNADGSGIDWTFTQPAGNRAGEDYDREVNGAVITWMSPTLTVNDGTGSDSDLTNSTSQLSANWTISSEVGVNEYQYAIGTSAGAWNVVSYTSTGMTKNVTKTGLSLSDGSTYYFTVRAIDGSGETLIQASSDGILVDASGPTFSNISATGSSSSILITWTTNEPATTKVKYGLTSSYGSETTEDTSLATSHSVTLSGLNENTTYHFQLLGTDVAGNVGSTSDQVAATSTDEPTVITNVQVRSLSDTSVEVTWDTNHPADSKVRYGTTTDYGSEVYDGTLVTDHSIIITGLIEGQQYHYEVLSTGNTVAIDADATFTAGGINAPTIIAPIENATVGGRPLITGLAESGSDVFLILDGELLKVVKTTTSSDGTGNFHFQVIDALSAGTHTLITRARDADGDVSPESNPRTFLVGNPYPAPILFTPVVRDGNNPSVTIPGLAKTGSIVTIFLDGKSFVTFTAVDGPDGVASFAYRIENISAGEHTVKLQARSAAGKVSGFSQSFRFVFTPSKTQPILRPDQKVRYVVKSGDSLWRIAAYLYDNGSLWRKIAVANVKNFARIVIYPHIIQSGWVLKIPKL